jgi:carbamate kinase
VRTIVALGGNALVRPGERGTVEEQLSNVQVTCEALRPLLDGGGGELVITHGNGPQVGLALRRQERAADEVPPLPLWLTVAQTQAEIGTLLATELTRVARRHAACLLTHVIVDPRDPAFARPTKPIGPSYTPEEAVSLRRERGWTLVEDSGRGLRRVVPSPPPVSVVEARLIADAVRSGALLICCGGGGIPVCATGPGHRGVDAVVDKDRTSAVLGAQIEAGRLVIVTDVPAIFRGFGTSDQEAIDRLSVEEAELLAPELAAGSIGPKVEAAAAFVRATGGDVLITSAAALAEALAGRAGTRIGLEASRPAGTSPGTGP